MPVTCYGTIWDSFLQPRSLILLIYKNDISSWSCCTSIASRCLRGVYRDSFSLHFFPVAQQPNAGGGRLVFLRYLDHTHWHITVNRIPSDEGSAHRRDLFLTTHNTHKRKRTMPPAGLEPAIPASDWSQTLASTFTPLLAVLFFF